MIALLILAAVFIVYSLVAAPLDRWSITAPMVFVITGAAIGLLAPEWVGFLGEPEPVTLIAELTLGLLLFADASTLRWRELREDGVLPIRLLIIGFPLTVAAGFLVGSLMIPATGLAVTALIAAILAPTDAALGLGIFTDRAVPGRIRRALNVESGLNDGLATPVVTLFLALVIVEEGSTSGNWLAGSSQDLAVALVVGLIVGAATGRLIVEARARSWTSPLSERLAVLASALLSYSAAVAIEGNGFVAAFVAGLAFSVTSGGRLHESIEFTEDLGMFASFLVWSIFGFLLLAPVLELGFSWTPLLYAILSLTVIRMIPVALAMLGSGLSRTSILFMGWFGPRGLASVVFTLIAFETFHHEGLAASGLVEYTTWTVFLSIIAHGLTARPMARLYGKSVSGRSAEHLRTSSPHQEPVPRSLGHLKRRDNP